MKHSGRVHQNCWNAKVQIAYHVINNIVRRRVQASESEPLEFAVGSSIFFWVFEVVVDVFVALDEILGKHQVQVSCREQPEVEEVEPLQAFL